MVLDQPGPLLGGAPEGTGSPWLEEEPEPEIPPDPNPPLPDQLVT